MVQDAHMEQYIVMGACPHEPSWLGLNAMAQNTKKELQSYIGATPKQVARELRKFARSERVLSSQYRRLIEEHPEEWVGLYDGKICAFAKSFDALMSQLKKRALLQVRR
jgi:hypothetical protein